MKRIPAQISLRLLGLALVAGATMLLEVTLTRIFSVTMWYHFAFLAVSLAMLGLSAGAVVVAAAPGWFPAARDPHRLSLLAVWFAVSIPLALAVHLAVPLAPEASLGHFLRFSGAIVVMAMPFVVSGACVCLALTRSAGSAGVVYAADLAGAAIGGLLAPVLLPPLGGPGTALAAAVLAALGAFAFAVESWSRDARSGAAAVALVMAILLLAQAAGERRGLPPLWLHWVKGEAEAPALWTRWNAHSRVRVAGDPAADEVPVGWGFSARLPASLRVRQLSLRIDGSASTMLTRFRGDLRVMSFLRYDVTAAVHRLRPGVPVAVIGAGGGRDALAALVMHQPHVTAIEINGAILEAVHERFGEFTGHLNRRFDLTWVHGEGRSFLAGTSDRFGVIELALVDTWAASAAGALALAEHSLYTVEAWRLFQDRLLPGGIISCSRYYRPDHPVEMYRLAALAVASLRANGAAVPRKHVMVLREAPSVGSGRSPDSSIGTLLASRDPFTSADIRRLRGIAADLGFTVALDPQRCPDPLLRRIADGEDPRMFPGLTLDPPTDDRPYFFFYGRLRDLFTRWFWTPRTSPSAPQLLAWSCAVLGLLSLVLVALPLFVSPVRFRAAHLPVAGFFALIGAGFMLAEIGWTERLGPFLGAPVYALVVTLCGLLAAAGGGSALAGRLPPRRQRPLFVLLPIVVAGAGLLAGPLIARLPGAPLTVRMLVALLLIVPPGLLMGLPFAAGLAAAQRVRGDAAWMWAINGAASVLGAAAAYLICLTVGIPASFLAAGLCYLGAVLLVRRPG